MPMTMIVTFRLVSTMILFAFLALAAVVLPLCKAQHVLRLATLIDSHMVLQRAPAAARLWGWATPSTNVTATLFKNHHHHHHHHRYQTVSFAIADANSGAWTIELPPQKASTGNQIRISNGMSDIYLQDVAFGDVYLCSGQSNMQMSVQDAFNATAEIDDSINHFDLRLATVAMVTSQTPQMDVPSKAVNYTWTRANPAAFDTTTPFSYFSATCYFFGRHLYQNAGGGRIPIGLVVSAWGGQRVETFSSPDALQDDTCGGTTVKQPPPPPPPLLLSSSFAWPPIQTMSINHPNVKKQPRENGMSYATTTKRTTTTRRTTTTTTNALDMDAFVPNYDKNDDSILQGPGPSEIWNAMIYPLLPMRFDGVIWYQGEANAGDPVSYACRFPAMIADWRIKFDLPNLSFVYVELAAYAPGETWPFLRAAQQAALQLPRVGMATAIDLADESSPAGAIHPRRKQEVGRRLALTVLAVQYGKQNLVHTGPVLVFVDGIVGRNGVTLFYEPDTAQGLHFDGAADCTACCTESPFQVLDASTGNWTRVSASTVQGPDKVMLETPVKHVVGIRYAWEASPQCLLYNGEGGPDNHAGIPAAPLEHCLFPSQEGHWTGKACKSIKVENDNLNNPVQS